MTINQGGSFWVLGPEDEVGAIGQRLWVFRPRHSLNIGRFAGQEVGRLNFFVLVALVGTVAAAG
ncbi:hypothetical protein [Streptosporangium subroseum]|uniref:hypothetical protein n=1 Tax=Streptosporangium subroseum TaxID=106412 RepID=UPI00308D44BB|nr:hypothetical protein OHB15_39835 [Streptosporangium subroseum]